MVTTFLVWILDNSIMLDKLLSRRQILFVLFFKLMIKTNAHDTFLEYPSSGTFLEYPSSGTFLEYPSSGTLKIERLEVKLCKSVWEEEHKRSLSRKANVG